MKTETASIELREITGRGSPTSMLYSLRTASSATLRPSSLVSQPGPSLGLEALQKMSPEELEAALQGELKTAQVGPTDADETSAIEGNHSLLLELSRYV